MNTLVKCHCCDGAGKVALSHDLQLTLDAIDREEWNPTQWIARRLPSRPKLTPTAVNNRLRYLEKAGLIESERRGLPVYWRRVK